MRHEPMSVSHEAETDRQIDKAKIDNHRDRASDLTAGHWVCGRCEEHVAAYALVCPNCGEVKA